MPRGRLILPPGSRSSRSKRRAPCTPRSSPAPRPWGERYAGLEIIRGDAERRAAQEGEGVHMARQQCILLQVERRLNAAVPAERKTGHKQVHLPDLAGHRVHESHRGHQPVDLHAPARLVPDGVHHVAGHRVLPAPLTEPVERNR